MKHDKTARRNAFRIADVETISHYWLLDKFENYEITATKRVFDTLF